MLVLARESRELTQAQVAELAGITQGAISKAENGLRELTDENLDAVATALSYPREFFLQQEAVKGPNACVHHRKRSKLPTKALRRIEARMNVERLRAHRLLRLVEVETTSTWPSLDIDSYGSPQVVARHLRAHWALPSGPIRDLTRVVEAAGGIVMAVSFGTTDLSGMSQRLPDGRPYFFLNADLPADHVRTTLAHEIAHVVMHELPTPNQEDEAKQFAAEFLMPEDDIKFDLQRLTFQRVLALKLHWRVSMQALLIRARDLGTISDRTYTRMQSAMSRSGYHRNEPNPLVPEEPSVLGQVIAMHLTDHDYTIDELARVAVADPDELESVYVGGKPFLRVMASHSEAPRDATLRAMR